MTTIQKIVSIPIDAVLLEGTLVVPPAAKALIVFAHGSGSSRFSPRNNFVAQILQKANFATLLFDLLTTEEDSVYATRFDIELLAHRLKAVTEWVAQQEDLQSLSIGYFGASTGAAAALKAAAQLPDGIVKAIVSRGGRPDLAAEALAKVQSPTLLIVGGNDSEVLQLNRNAFDALTGEKQLSIVEGATHLFEESGALEKVAELAVRWFKRHLVVPE